MRASDIRRRPAMRAHAMAYVLAGRARHAAAWNSPTGAPSPRSISAASSRIIDFALVQRAELRHPPHRRRHPVQGAQPDPPSAARLELLSPGAQRKLRHPAGQPARRRRPSGTSAPPTRCIQNIDIIESYAPRYIVMLAGDHIYKMDYEPMLQQHVEQRRRRHRRLPGGAASPRPPRFGVMHVDATDRIVAFLEKPADPPPMPGTPGHGARQHGHLRLRHALFLFEQLRSDAADPTSSHDFGKDIIPRLVAEARKPWRIRSRAPACGPAPRPCRIGAMSARSMPISRPTST